MAIVVTTVTPDASPFAWNDLPSSQSALTDVPRREIRYMSFNENVAAGGAGNNQLVASYLVLPAGYAYALVDLYVSLENRTAGAVNNFDDVGSVTFQDAIVDLDRHIEFPFDVISNGSASVSTDNKRVKSYVPTVMPKLVMKSGSANEQCQLLVFVYNPTPNDYQYHFNLFARFLQYDVSQANHWSVNTPTLTR